VCTDAAAGDEGRSGLTWPAVLLSVLAAGASDDGDNLAGFSRISALTSNNRVAISVET
jgi:hypothetical protein